MNDSKPQDCRSRSVRGARQNGIGNNAAFPRVIGSTLYAWGHLHQSGSSGNMLSPCLSQPEADNAASFVMLTDGDFQGAARKGRAKSLDSKRGIWFRQSSPEGKGWVHMLDALPLKLMGTLRLPAHMAWWRAFMEDTAHDFDHLVRVMAIADSMQTIEGGDLLN